MNVSASIPQAIAARVRLWRCARVGREPSVRGRVWIRGAGCVTVGDNVVFDASAAPIELHAYAGAEIYIGDGARLDGGVSVEAQRRVFIGAGAHLRAFSKVMDCHLHVLRGDRSYRPVPQTVEIGPGVCVGARAIVLPGAKIRAGSALAPDSIVRGAPPIVSELGQATPQARTLPRRLYRLVGVARARILFADCECGVRVAANGPVRVFNKGRLRLADRVSFAEGMIPTELICHAGAELSIGPNCVVNYGATLESYRSVVVGARCLIASSVRIGDRDGDRIEPVVLGDDVWVAHGATIRAGVTIGAGSAISAGAVVTHDIPPGSLAAGRPARAIPLSLTAR